MRAIAPGEPARAVAGDDRTPKGCPDHRSPAADVERLRGPGGDDPAHRGVAGDPTGRLRMDRTDVIELRPSGCVPSECVEVDGHRHVRPFAGDGRLATPVQPTPADLPERVGPALRGRPA